MALSTSSSAHAPALAQAMEVEPGLNKDTADLIVGLRKIREDCCRAAEYAGSLDAIMEKRRKEQAQQIRELRAARRLEQLGERLVRKLSVHVHRQMRKALGGWRLLVPRLRILRRHAEEELLRLRLCRLLCAWHQGMTTQKTQRRISGLELNIADARSRLESEVPAMQERILEHNQAGAFKEMRRIFNSAMSELRWRVFVQWGELSKAETMKKRRSERLLANLDSSTEGRERRLLQELLGSWRGAVFEAKRARGEDPSSIKMRAWRAQQASQKMLGYQKHLLKKIYGAWWIEAETTREARVAETHVTNVEEQCKLELERLWQQTHKSVTRIFKAYFCAANLTDFFDAWRGQCEDDAQHRRLKNRFEDLHESATDISSRLDRYERLNSNWNYRCDQQSMTLMVHLCFAVWAIRIGEQRREFRLQQEARVRQLCAKHTAEAHELQEKGAWAALTGLSNVLRARSSASLRSTWQDWRFVTRESRNCESSIYRSSLHDDAVRDLAFVQKALLRTTTERKRLERSLSAGFHGALREGVLVHDAAVALTALLQLTCLQQVFIAWNFFLQSESERQLHENECFRFQADEREIEKVKREAREAHAHSALKIMLDMDSQMLLTPIFNAWYNHQQRAYHERILQKEADALKAKQAEERLRHKARWDRQAAVHMERVAAALLLKGLADESALMHLILVDWLDVLNSKRSMASSILRRFIHVSLYSVLDLLPVLIQGCVRCWWAITMLSGMAEETQNLAEQTALESFRAKSVHRLVSRFSGAVVANYRTSALQSVMIGWQRVYGESKLNRTAWLAECERKEKEFAAQEAFQASVARAAEFRQLAGQRAAALAWLANLRIHLSAWRRAMHAERWESQFAAWAGSGGDLLQVQTHIASVSHERCVENCFAIRRKQRAAETVTRFLNAWLLAAAACRARRQHAGSIARARHLAEGFGAERRDAARRQLFTGWHRVAHRSRRRWLERRRIQLQKLAKRQEDSLARNARAGGLRTQEFAAFGALPVSSRSGDGSGVAWLAPQPAGSARSTTWKHTADVAESSVPLGASVHVSARAPIMPSGTAPRQDDAEAAFAARFWRYAAAGSGPSIT